MQLAVPPFAFLLLLFRWGQGAGGEGGGQEPELDALRGNTEERGLQVWHLLRGGLSCSCASDCLAVALVIRETTKGKFPVH